MLAYLDVLKTDAVEADLLTDEPDIKVAAQMLSDLGRSGRGDTCVAAYVARRLTASPAEATIWAAAVTSLKMEGEGPFRRNMGEVKDLIRRMYRG